MSEVLYDKRDDFDFEIVEFPFLVDGDVARSKSYGVYISQLASSHVSDLNTCNKLLTKKLLKQGYRYHNFAKPFLNFIDDTII